MRFLSENTLQISPQSLNASFGAVSLMIRNVFTPGVFLTVF